MTAQEKTLHIDIPVRLPEVKVVFSVASLSFEGDLPAFLFHLSLILNDISNWKAALAPKIAAALLTCGAMAAQEGEKSTGNKIF